MAQIFSDFTNEDSCAHLITVSFWIPNTVLLFSVNVSVMHMNKKRRLLSSYFLFNEKQFNFPFTENVMPNCEKFDKLRNKKK